MTPGTVVSSILPEVRRKTHTFNLKRQRNVIQSLQGNGETPEIYPLCTNCRFYAVAPMIKLSNIPLV